MFEESELSLLVSNVLHENRYSHCRLCLRLISEEYVRFDDYVALDSCGAYKIVSEILTKLLGDEVCEEISGINAVCMECIDQAITATKFLHNCEKSSQILHNVFDSLSNTLSVDVNTTNSNSSLYITVANEHASKLILVKKQPKQKELRTISKKDVHCPECLERFANNAELKVHYITYHGMLVCMKCNEIVANETELSAHDNIVQDYECPDCDKRQCTEESLKNHQHKSHAMYVCKDCGKSFKGIDRLHLHEQKHVTKSTCPKCGKTYNTKQFFLKHVKLCLEGQLDPHPVRSKFQKTYSCKQCGKGYSTPGGLRVHNRFVHGNAKPHVCEYCNKQFTAPSYLKVHMISHTGEKNFKCSLCAKKFVSKEALLYHTRRHTGEKPYSCTMCDEKFVNGSARAEHIKFKHVGPTLMCEICSRKFVTPSFLKLHMKKHYDPTNKLYAGRSLIPPNVPAVENMRVKCYE